jgi:hypothetical protein
MAEMRKLTSYFGQFDGTGKSWSEVEPYFAALFHKDCEIITVTKAGDKTITYDEWGEFLQDSLTKHADIQMTKVEKVPEGIQYTASLIYPGRDPIVFSSVGVFQDGQIIKVTPATK